MLPAPHSDVDAVLCLVDRICQALREAPASTWQQLAAAGRRMNPHDADMFTYGVELAIHHDRGALLTRAWQQIHGHVHQHVPVHASPSTAMVQATLSAAIMALVLADLVHRDTFDHLVRPAAPLVHLVRS